MEDRDVNINLKWKVGGQRERGLRTPPRAVIPSASERPRSRWRSHATSGCRHLERQRENSCNLRVPKRSSILNRSLLVPAPHQGAVIPTWSLPTVEMTISCNLRVPSSRAPARELMHPEWAKQGYGFWIDS